MTDIKVIYKDSLEDEISKIKAECEKFKAIEKPRIKRSRMHSVPIAIPPGVPVAWTSLTLPNGKVISTYSVGDEKAIVQEGYSFGPENTTCELVFGASDQPIDIKSGEASTGTSLGPVAGNGNVGVFD